MKYSVGKICSIFGYSRQAYYKSRQAQMKVLIDEHLIISEVKRIRKRQPRVGGRKLHKMLQARGFQVGRDRLFKILENFNLLVRPKKNYTKTTNSFHRFRKYGNLIKDLKITRPNEVFVSDITYLATQEGFCYLSLVTDVYSRKIVGYDVSDSLAIEGAQRALRMALKKVSEPGKLIHHSDRGIQYCSNGYVNILEEKEVSISMTEDNHCYENSLAERVNGILKDEFLLGERLPSLSVARKAVRQSISIYNEERLHMSLEYEIPSMRYAA